MQAVQRSVQAVLSLQESRQGSVQGTSGRQSNGEAMENRTNPATQHLQTTGGLELSCNCKRSNLQVLQKGTHRPVHDAGFQVGSTSTLRWWQLLCLHLFAAVIRSHTHTLTNHAAQQTLTANSSSPLFLLSQPCPRCVIRQQP